MSDLKPCPHCGGEAKLDEHCGKYVVFCTSEKCSWRNTEAEAIEAWNTRAETPHACECCPQINNVDSFIYHLLQADNRERKVAE